MYEHVSATCESASITRPDAALRPSLQGSVANVPLSRVEPCFSDQNESGAHTLFRQRKYRISNVVFSEVGEESGESARVFGILLNNNSAFRIVSGSDRGCHR
jgi:hypothetical protein